LFLVVGVLVVALALISLGLALFGSADQRGTGFGLVIGEFGSGFVNVLLSVAFRAISRMQ
jgi:hypothetical protein